MAHWALTLAVLAVLATMTTLVLLVLLATIAVVIGVRQEDRRGTFWNRRGPSAMARLARLVVRHDVRWPPDSAGPAKPHARLRRPASEPSRETCREPTTEAGSPPPGQTAA
jgi:hypothetical protein